MSKQLYPGWEDCAFYIEDHLELTCIAIVEKGEVILTREGMVQQEVCSRATVDRSNTARKSSEMETARHRRRREKGAQDTGPNGAERPLPTAPSPASDTPPAAQEHSALTEIIDEWPAHLLQSRQKNSSEEVEMAARLTAPLPPALPPHITALGEQRQLAAGHGRRWVGCARATPDELRGLKGIVVYDGAVSCFLAEDEAREVFVTLGKLLMQLECLHVGGVRAREEQKGR